MFFSPTQLYRWVLALWILLASIHSYADDIIQSENDSRHYRSVTLGNGLQVLLISDPNADKAAASMDIGIGSNANPNDRLGLAHFLEHMLFLGTKKYPEAGEYQAFIRSHGGNHNAFTANTTTNYYFDIQSDHLFAALDRFAQFFIAPLFEEKYTDRERHAVHSEYRAKIRDDSRRTYAIYKQVMNPDHPGKRFAVGNLETLSNKPAGTLQHDMLAFYQTYYSANQMKLVVLGKEPLPQLEAQVRQYFSAIPNRNLAPFKVTVPTYRAADLPMEVLIEPVKDLRQLSLTFPLPATKRHWRNKPASLIAGLIGYEGEGSLLAYLKKQGWATGLGAYSDSSSDVETLLNVSITLTREGLQQRDEVIRAFFAFMQALRTTGIPQHLFDEEQILTAHAFRFIAKQEPIHYVSQLAQQMREYPQRHWLDASFVLEERDSTLTQQLLKAITPHNMVVSVQAKGLTTDHVEPFYHAPFAMHKIASERLNLWHNAKQQPQLYVRHSNPFIPASLALNELTEHMHPVQLTPTAKVETWYLPDATFKRPKADVYFTLLSPYTRQGAAATVALNLYIGMLNEQLNSVLYDAATAGLSANLYAHSRGITVRISGYNDKIDLLTQTVAQALRQPVWSEERFNMVKQTYLDALNNATQEKPFQQLYRIGYEVLLRTPSLAELTAEAQKATLADIKKVPAQLFSRPFVRLFAHGNITTQQTQAIAHKVATTLELATVAKHPLDLKVSALTDHDVLRKVQQIEQNDTAQIIYLQGANSDLQTRAQVALLTEILAAPFYSELRTEQQLGYIVFASPLVIRDHPGVAFVVQSPHATTEHIETRINAFLANQINQVAVLSDGQLQRFKNSLISRLTSADKNRQARTNRYWQTLDKMKIDFTERDQLVEAIKAIEQTQLADALKALSTRRMVLSSHPSVATDQ